MHDKIILDGDLFATVPPPPPRRRAAKPARPIHITRFERERRDFYATPSWVTEALLRRVTLRGPVWEPCCGTGAISTVLESHGHRVVSTDIDDHGYGTPGVDIFSRTRLPEGCCSLVTNPPYGDSGSHGGQSRSSTAMLNFLRHCLDVTAPAGGQLALLVRLQWISGRRAAAVMSDAPWTAVVALTRRIRWFDMGEHTKNAQHHHAWVVFDFARTEAGPPVLLFGD